MPGWCGHRPVVVKPLPRVYTARMSVLTATLPRWQAEGMGTLRIEFLRMAILALCVGALTPCAFATPHAPVADLQRLAGYGDGPITATSPGLDLAAGSQGASALGDRGCDAQGMVYRELIHPRVHLNVISPGARRLDLILRATHEAREVTVTLDGEALGSAVVNASWQRLSFRTQPLKPGPHRLSFTMTPTGERLESAEPAHALALLHSVRLSTHVQAPTESVVERFAGSDTLWLEAGERLRIPLVALPSHALTTLGTHKHGKDPTTRITVSLETEEGAVEQILSLPGALTLPWNLHLADAGATIPRYLHLEASGDNQGAIGLKGAKLSAPVSPSKQPSSTIERLVLVLVPGLRSDDALAPLMALPDAQVGEIWSNADRPTPALASLMTGQHLAGHRVTKRSDRLSGAFETLAKAHQAARGTTILRAGNVASTKDTQLWSGYSDAAFSSGGSFGHTAEKVLEATLDAVRKAPTGPLLATAVLGDLSAPYLPRADAWRAHWPSGERPLWEPLKGRKALLRQRAKSQGPSDGERRFWRALRRGKVDELVTALRPFLSELQATGNTQIMVIGLGGSEPFPPKDAPDLGALQAPFLITGTGPASLPEAPADLTDLHATLVKLLGLATTAGVGSPYTARTPAPWLDPAYATVNDRWDLQIEPSLAMVRDRFTGATSWLTPKVDAKGVTRWRERSESSAGEALVDLLRERLLVARRGAKARWKREHYSVTSPPGRVSGIGALCER